MSGFDADWLALREPVDHASRNKEVGEQVRRHFQDRPSLAIVDLGCGTGSNLRALAPLLPALQRWHLIDGDDALLSKARRVLGGWADRASETATGIRLHKDGREIDVRFECADLTVRDLDFSDVGAELVTCAALFDLVSAPWLERLVARSAHRRLPLYAVLNYDGAARWRPDDPLDARVIAAFNRHQRGDKGFGPALGPTASATLGQILSRHGYAIWSGDSPWQLTRNEAGLIAALTDGFAGAATEIEPEGRQAFADWASARAKAEAVTIGHQDLFARA
ncbi:class I SAM-dependent methyltransferase [Ancylobacter pratisalsi]|uniref:Class I SAM-dependent methyltransferase n=1 Tax=Ancylobacter pratisalsi TaxID=1745854 RepID=A0A6P1YHJ4_9HYPH|nr:class I SAM-dependent methyltransferase [Ancylobacter pratisalsi]QIB32440.1 class I SAM-dependent methyltransferase [Ancylobacter pratisalsi]